MPYIKKQEKDFVKVQRLIRGYCSSSPQLAKVLDVSQPTALKKLNNPSELTLADLQKISQRLHIPIEELRGVISW